MFRLEVRLYPRSSCSWISAGLEERVGKGNCDQGGNCHDEEGEKLTLLEVSKSLRGGSECYIPAHRNCSRCQTS